MPSPVRPAAVAPTKSIRFTVRIISGSSLAADPSRLSTGRFGRSPSEHPPPERALIADSQSAENSRPRHRSVDERAG